MGRSLSLEGMGSPWVTLENAVSSVQQKNEVLLPGSMTAAAVSWQGRLGVAGGGFAVISSRPTLFKMSLCAANLDEGRREGGSGYFSTKWEGERSQIIDVSPALLMPCSHWVLGRDFVPLSERHTASIHLIVASLRG